ncbi:hypothetical protein [Lactococcus fujiensis]|nr:hypothetical protein [Lactococcus fujiensis]
MNINNNFYPIQVLPGIPSKNGIKFLGENEIEVIIDNANLIWNILSKCNGKTNVIDILKSLTNDSVNTLDIISDLAEIGIIVDSRKQFYLFHELIKSPSKYFYDLTTEEIKQIEESDPP